MKIFWLLTANRRQTSTSSGGISLVVNWQTPTFDGSGATLSGLTGYRISWGSSSQNYTYTTDVGLVNTYTITGLTAGTWYYAIQTLGSGGSVGEYSPENSATVADQVSTLPFAGTDNFDDNVFDTTLWRRTSDIGSGLAAFAEAGGQIRMTNLGVTGGTHYGGMESLSTSDFTNKSAYIKFVSAATSQASIQRYFAVAQTGSTPTALGNSFAWFEQGGVLKSYYFTSGTTNQVGVNLDTGADNIWVRIRETSGAVFWEYAADVDQGGGVHVPGNWTTNYSIATPFTITAMRAQLWAGQFSSGPQAIHAFDGFNTSSGT